MYGVVTRNAEEVTWPEFDRGFYEVKDVSGRITDPISNAVNMVSCFGDSATAETDPGLVPVNSSGERATRDQPYFDWSYICPSREEYSEEVLGVIAECASVNESVRLDDVGFPRAEYCRCETCEARFSDSTITDWFAWRASVITAFVEAAVDRIPGRSYFTVYPDPYPGHLFERAGIELAAIESLVDEFVVPLYDLAYETTYWLEVIASGFQDAVSIPFSIELYAVNVDIDNLVHATHVASEYAKDVYFGYDSSNARAVVRRIEADKNPGVSHGK